MFTQTEALTLQTMILLEEFWAVWMEIEHLHTECGHRDRTWWLEQN